MLFPRAEAKERISKILILKNIVGTWKEKWTYKEQRNITIHAKHEQVKVATIKEQLMERHGQDNEHTMKTQEQQETTRTHHQTTTTTTTKTNNTKHHNKQHQPPQQKNKKRQRTAKKRETQNERKQEKKRKHITKERNQCENNINTFNLARQQKINSETGEALHFTKPCAPQRWLLPAASSFLKATTCQESLHDLRQLTERSGSVNDTDTYQSSSHLYVHKALT